MPIDYKQYPKDWKEISQHIRFERAGGKCEWCHVEHGAVGARDKDGNWYDENDINAMNSDYGYTLWPDVGFPYMIKIILTTAHLGIDKPDGTKGDKRDKSDCRPENLAALCQKCRLNFDRDDHAENARETNYQKRVQARRDSGLQTLPGFEKVMK